MIKSKYEHGMDDEANVFPYHETCWLMLALGVIVSYTLYFQICSTFVLMSVNSIHIKKEHAEGRF